ncbi:hypothetical protein Pla123a_29340 [Posidoniimonas polymericola]|uniref:Uncharacterized protein n=1 Tax=Posidoniimonas polymericola TaxID=2528002 RepID=A0A5C5YMR0_9BACT|nr:hypothetical protein [Posidoniimonas polymericola]TWT76145.1 hypothetical protein Pla123a_29340 [Posidoniimonas polymericola]
MSTPHDKNALSQVRRRVRRIWSWLGILAIAAGAGAWYLVCFCPAAEQLDAHAANLTAEYAYLDSETTLIERLRDEASTNESYAEELKRLRERSNAQPDEVAFLGWMGEQATRCSLSLTNYRPDGQVTHGAFAGRALQISGTGGYEGICRVLFAIRGRSQMTRLASMTIRPEGQDRERFGFVLQIELLHGATKTEEKGGDHV